MMIATGGLLRINARRQDSLRSKTHKAQTHKRKNKKKRRSEVVVVKGKLKLCSVSGLMAALGILVLMVGVVMAALGYWPRGGLFFSAGPQEGAALASVSSPADTQDGGDGLRDGGAIGGDEEDRRGDEEDRRGDEEDKRGDEEDRRGDEEDRQGDETLNVTGSSEEKQYPAGFLDTFLSRYLYSDRLKVLGPLIMGIGIFLFICANAVLHENRDKKTKVINLRDIYSTVIDLHSLRRPAPGSTRRSSALNSLVNYVQSKSLETKPHLFPPSLLSHKEVAGERGSRQLPGGGGCQGNGDSPLTVCKEPRDSAHRLSLPPSLSPALRAPCWASLTLPLRRQRPPSPQRRHSVRTCSARSWTAATPQKDQHGEGPVQEPARPSQATAQASASVSCSSSSLLRGAPLLLSSSSLSPSHLSLSSLSHLLSSASSTPAGPSRRRSLPACGSAAGYSKLSHGEEESFESTETAAAARHVTSHRKFSNEQKLRMISQTSRPGQSDQSETRGEAGQPPID